MTGGGAPSARPDTLGQVLAQVREHLARFICTVDPCDLDTLTLWAAHTHVCEVTYTTPRLILDSTMPGSGKTTVLDHLSRLCLEPIQAANISSSALLGRLFANGPRTLLLDEVDRTLDPKRESTGEFVAILNSGYRVGGTRPVLEGPRHEVVEMPTYGPVVMAGNTPNLPDDTRSRSIRLLLMPDLRGQVESSDWEELEPHAQALGAALAAALADSREAVRAARPDLPPGCVARFKEKWNPLARVAEAAGGDWPQRCRELIVRDLEEAKAEAEAGIMKRPPVVILLEDLHGVWPEGREFIPTSELVSALIIADPDYWGELSAYGRALTPQRMGKLLTQIKVKASKNAQGQRGYARVALLEYWRAHGFMEPQPPDGAAEWLGSDTF